MTYEWVMFNAVLSQAKNPDMAFDTRTLRMHLLDGARQRESVGFVEQRILRRKDTQMFFLTVLRGERIDSQHIDDMQTGMDILDLVSRERSADD